MEMRDDFNLGLTKTLTVADEESKLWHRSARHDISGSQTREDIPYCWSLITWMVVGEAI